MIVACQRFDGIPRLCLQRVRSANFMRRGRDANSFTRDPCRPWHRAPLGHLPENRRRHTVASKVSQSLADDRLDRLAVPPNLAKEHGTLNGAEAEVGHMLFVRFRRQTSKRLLLNKKNRQFVLDHLEDEAEVLPDQLVLLGHLVSHCPEGAAARHAKALLHFNLRCEPALQIVPRRDLVTNKGGARFDLLGAGATTLEWTLPSPPPFHSYETLPRIE